MSRCQSVRVGSLPMVAPVRGRNPAQGDPRGTFAVGDEFGVR